MPISLIILLAALVAVAFRKMVSIPIPIWVIMAAGAILSLLFRQISPLHALLAINPDVMIYLFGVFLISQATEMSGYLGYLTDRLFLHANTGKHALLIITFILGLSAALLMNDTIAIVGTPIILQLCQQHKKLAKPLLLALAYAVTIGSVISPVGNPQNLLIAVKSDMASPFLNFLKVLAIPTLINLVIAYLLIYIVYRKTLDESLEKPIPIPINGRRIGSLIKVSLAVLLILLASKVLIDIIVPSPINFSYIPLIASLPILFSKQRWLLIKKLDWGTLVFFASTFVLMESVWESGFFQTHIQQSRIMVTTIPIILVLSVILSQFISNVPLVALYLPLLLHHDLPISHLLALAAGSTLAGNVSLLGAASNVIIIQNAEKRGNEGFGFFEFAALGMPLTIISVLIYGFFLNKV
jgi:Na+/H+ antiporter NhaD/arsenite permease-like protein